MKLEDLAKLYHQTSQVEEKPYFSVRPDIIKSLKKIAKWRMFWLRLFGKRKLTKQGVPDKRTEYGIYWKFINEVAI